MHPPKSQVRDLTLQTLDRQGMSQRELAEEIGYSTASLSAYLKDKYPAPHRIEAALVPWLRKHGTQISEDDLPGEFVETEAAASTVEACTIAQEEGEIAVVIGAAGVGKTVGLREWARRARREKIRYVAITANVTTGPVALVRQISAALDLPTSPPAASQIERIVDTIRRRPAVILIDEAQHLGVRALEAARALHDETETGIVFAGSIALQRTLVAGGGAVELGQLQGRIGIFTQLKPLTQHELHRFLERWVGQVDDPAVLEEIRIITQRIPRRLVRLLGHCRRLLGSSGRTLSVGLIREAATRLVAAP